MIIRKATINDIENILILDIEFTGEYKNYDDIQDISWASKYGKEYYLKLISENDNLEVILAEIDGKIVGYMEVEYNIIEEEFRNEIFSKIQEFFVLKEYRNKGIGSKLYDFFENEAKKTKTTIITFSTNINDLLAINFYKKNGFQEREIVFEKKL